jgi:hypothetical protein
MGNAMTHRERLLVLLTEFGIQPSKSRYLPDRYRDESCIVLYEGDGGVGGYEDYFCVFTFDERGTFVAVEVLE